MRKKLIKYIVGL